MSKFEELKQRAEKAIETRDDITIWKAYSAAEYSYNEGRITGDEMFQLAKMMIVDHCIEFYFREGEDNAHL